MSYNRSPVRLRACRRGATAVEFALVGGALMTLLVGFMYVGYCLFAQSALDQAAAGVARQFWTGKNTDPSAKDSGGAYNPNNDTPGPSAPGSPPPQGFKSAYVCSQMVGLLYCDNVKVYNYPVTDFSGTNSSTLPASGNGTGQTKQTMVLRLVYNAPLPVWPVLGTAGSSSLLTITSTIPYVNEY